MAVSRFIDVFEAYDRFANGKRVTEQQWDYEIIPRRAKMLKESYDLFFGHEIIPTDDEMCDRLFMAGMDMLLSCGIYCTDLGKALTIEEEEIYQGLKMAPKKLTLGTGKDKCTLKPRRGNSFRKPIVEGGPTGAPISENIFEKVIASYAQEPMVDGIVSGVINTINGRSVVTDSPWEIKATMSEIRHIREAVSMAGRPGMGIQGPETPLSAVGRMSASMVNNGLRSCDCHECSQMNELKVNTSFMNMIAGWHLSGDTIMIEQMPIMGGYVSSVEETAICDVAATLASFVLYNCDIHLDGPVHIRWGNTSNRECLQVAAHAARALDANTDVLLANQYYTIAGPCTEMCLLEVAAQAIVDTVSGRELLSGVAPGKGVLQDRATGLEARMLGEASSAACGMSIEAANGIVDNILHRYELNYHHAPMGKKFQECYNLDTLRPSQEYLDIYENAMHTISLCGMDF